MIERKEIYAVLGVSPPRREDVPLSEQGEIKRGHGKKYRGNHRSHVKGAGMMAFLRNKWMKSIVFWLII